MPVKYILSIIFCLFLTVICSINYLSAQNSSNAIIYDTVFVYDTVWEYETVYDTVWVYDTVFVEQELPPKKELTPYEIENLSPSFAEPMQFKQSINSKEYKQQYYERNLNQYFSTNIYYGVVKHSIPSHSGVVKYGNLSSSAQAKSGYSIGVNICYNNGNMGIGTGIGYLSLSDALNYSLSNSDIDSIANTIQIKEVKNITDSVRYFDPNSITNGDTVWKTYYYTYNKITYRDSNYYSYDTTTSIAEYNVINRYNLLEIPVIFSFSFNLKYFDLLIKAGMVNQIHIASIGKVIAENGVVRSILPNNDIVRYNMASYSSIGLSAELTQKVSIYSDIFFQYPLWQFSDFLQLGINSRTFGLRFGLKYKFNQ